jgi:hypothetical protein
MGSKRSYKLGINKKFGLVEKAVSQREYALNVVFEVLTAAVMRHNTF